MFTQERLSRLYTGFKSRLLDLLGVVFSEDNFERVITFFFGGRYLQERYEIGSLGLAYMCYILPFGLYYWLGWRLGLYDLFGFVGFVVFLLIYDIVASILLVRSPRLVFWLVKQIISLLPSEEKKKKRDLDIAPEAGDTQEYLVTADGTRLEVVDYDEPKRKNDWL